MQAKTMVLLLLAGFATAAVAADTNSGGFRRGVPQNSTTQTQVFDDKPQPVPQRQQTGQPARTEVTPVPDVKKTPPAQPPQEGGRKTPPYQR